MGTVPCLLWKWWTWCVVLREEETRAATAGHGNTSNASESTSLNSKAGLAHTTGDATTCLGTNSNPLSTPTSTSCSMGAGPEKKGRPLPLMRHKQEVNISKESRAHDSQPSSPGAEKNKEQKIWIKSISQERKKRKADPCLKIPKMTGNKICEKKNKYKLLFEMKDPKKSSAVKH
ncbi:hypothetical protein CHARACLAT_005604 [Characodon lateralis]|uniref:Prolactin receptor n=1 Tax=Characodon lateralis TaxID=208331 RepID=A0ABU7F1G7_9TELE|nr:hypothetical protein [Characodon lateralis]